PTEKRGWWRRTSRDHADRVGWWCKCRRTLAKRRLRPTPFRRRQFVLAGGGSHRTGRLSGRQGADWSCFSRATVSVRLALLRARILRNGLPISPILATG